MSVLTSCPWRPVTANGVDLLTEIYAIYMEAHTRYRVMLRPGPFYTFGTLPASLEASCRSLTFGQLPKLAGMLPIVPHLTLPGPELSHTWDLRPK